MLGGHLRRRLDLTGSKSGHAAVRAKPQNLPAWERHLTSERMLYAAINIERHTTDNRRWHCECFRYPFLDAADRAFNTRSRGMVIRWKSVASKASKSCRNGSASLGAWVCRDCSVSVIHVRPAGPATNSLPTKITKIQPPSHQRLGSKSG